MLLIIPTDNDANEVDSVANTEQRLCFDKSIQSTVPKKRLVLVHLPIILSSRKS